MSLLPMVVPQPKANRLIVIGWLGDKRAYLNITREEAIARYIEAEGESLDTLLNNGLIEEFDFDDEFWVYAANES